MRDMDIPATVVLLLPVAEISQSRSSLHLMRDMDIRATVVLLLPAAEISHSRPALHPLRDRDIPATFVDQITNKIYGMGGGF